MQPACAACLQPIRSRQDVVITGTEVLHKACARLGIQTELARVRECLASANADRGRALREKATAEAAHDTDRQRMLNEVLELRRIVTRLRDDLDSARSLTAAHERAWRVERAALLEREAAARRSTPEPASQPTTEPPREPQREIDGTSVRFSLLEFD